MMVLAAILMKARVGVSDMKSLVENQTSQRVKARNDGEIRMIEARRTHGDRFRHCFICRETNCSINSLSSLGIYG